MSKRLCKICKIKPHLNFHWLIGPSSIYVAKQQRTKWNHKKKNVLTFQWLCLILYLYKQFLSLSHPLLWDQRRKMLFKISLPSQIKSNHITETRCVHLIRYVRFYYRASLQLSYFGDNIKISFIYTVVN